MIFTRFHTRMLTAALLFFLLTAATMEGYREINRIPARGTSVSSDELGNAFLTAGNQLLKYSPAGKKLHTYSNLYSGDISHVDTQDPFKILLFYQPFAQVEFLDQTLSLTSSRIDLNQLGLGLASLVCTSYQGAIWVYNPVDFELLRIDQQLEVAERTGNLLQSTGLALDPNFMVERDNFLYLNDPAAGILIFDKYGSYYKTVPVKGLTSFQVFNNKIIFTRGDEVGIYDVKLNELSTTTLPQGEYRSAAVVMSLDPERLYMLLDDALVFYEIR